MGLIEKIKQFFLTPFFAEGERRRRTAKARKRKSSARRSLKSGASQKRRTSSASRGRARKVSPSARPSAQKKTPARVTKRRPEKKASPPKRSSVLRPAGSIKPLSTSSGTRAELSKKKAKDGKPFVLLGTVSHYFPKVKAAVIQLQGNLKIGDVIWIGEEVGAKGYRQKTGSLQINRIPIDEGRSGEEVGLEVLRDVGVGDKVFKLF